MGNTHAVIKKLKRKQISPNEEDVEFLLAPPPYYQTKTEFMIEYVATRPTFHLKRLCQCEECQKLSKPFPAAIVIAADQVLQFHFECVPRWINCACCECFTPFDLIPIKRGKNKPDRYLCATHLRQELNTEK